MDLFIQLTDIDPNWVRANVPTAMGIHRRGGTAVFSEDYRHPVKVTLTADDTVARVRVTLLQDELVEGPEDAAVCFYAWSGSSRFHPDDTCVTIRISDDDTSLSASRGPNQEDRCRRRRIGDRGGDRESACENSGNRCLGFRRWRHANNDYTLAVPPINFGPSQPGPWKVTLQTIEDSVVEGGRESDHPYGHKSARLGHGGQRIARGAYPTRDHLGQRHGGPHADGSVAAHGGGLDRDTDGASVEPYSAGVQIDLVGRRCRQTQNVAQGLIQRPSRCVAPLAVLSEFRGATDGEDVYGEHPRRLDGRRTSGSEWS